MGILKRVATGILAVCLLSAGVVFAADKPDSGGQNKTIDVLMIGHFTPHLNDPGWPKLQAALAAQGIRLSILGEGGQSVEYEKYTDDVLRKFHIVIYCGIPSEKYHNPTGASPAAIASFRDRLDAFHQAGGGVIWIPFSMGNGGKAWTEVIGKRYDVQSLEEAIFDPGKQLSVNSMFRGNRYLYVWTTNIASHPLTDGVKGLLIPMEGDWSWPGTVPMKYGASWIPLVRGMDSTVTIGNAKPFGDAGCDFKKEIKGSYDAAPELVGVRDAVGASGRMMVFPFFTAHTFKNFNSWFFDDAMMIKGYGGYRSDGLKLFVNCCKWLAEPAQKSGLGGYAPATSNAQSVVPPLVWNNLDYPANSWSGAGSWWNARTQKDVVMQDLVTPKARDFKGIIGARTAYGDGHGTVAEYVAEAKKLGLSFVVFLEDIKAIDDERYAKLVADCKAGSSDDFKAIPGYLFRDTLDVLYYTFGVDKLPFPANLTPDRHVKAPMDLACLPTGYPPFGLAELGKLKINPWYLYSYYSIAPYLYDDGKLVDDGFPIYRALQGTMHHQTPNSLTIVRAPGDLKKTVEQSHIMVYHAEDMSKMLMRFGHSKLWNPNPVYITSGPVISRWGTLNPIGQPFAAGRQRVRFALEVSAEAGLSDVRIIEARSGKLFRHFKPDGAKSFSCTVDETHKDQWYLIPVVTDMNGRTAIGSTIETFQDGNRIAAYMDNIDSGHLVIGWDEQRRKLMQFGGWLGEPWSVRIWAGGSPGNTRPEDLVVHGFDGGPISGSHCWVSPVFVSDKGSEPKFPAYRFENLLASFDYAGGDYVGDVQFPRNQKERFPGSNWGDTITCAQVPMEYADIMVRVGVVRARYHSSVAAKTNEVVVTVKKDCTLKRLDLCKIWRSFDWGPMFVAARDQEGEWVGMDDGKKNTVTRKGVMEQGGYLFMGNDMAGAIAVVNMDAVPLTYNCGGQRADLYLDGADRALRVGDKITVRFLMISKNMEQQNNNLWLKKFIADYAIGGGKPGYDYQVSRGRLKTVNYAMHLEAENGGAVVRIAKYKLPHNLLVKVSGVADNAVAGRYDPDRKQLLILPMHEHEAVTSVNTTLGDTKLYVGELFHCDSKDVLMSCTQDGADKLLLELHNPTDKALTAKLTAVAGFAPLAGLDRTLDVPAFSSVKLALSAVAGSLLDKPYEGD
ncbi:MAG: hypothetical protein WAX69_12155 [Victivallales bacterium]